MIIELGLEELMTTSPQMNASSDRQIIRVECQAKDMTNQERQPVADKELQIIVNYFKLNMMRSEARKQIKKGVASCNNQQDIFTGHNQQDVSSLAFLEVWY